MFLFLFSWPHSMLSPKTLSSAQTTLFICRTQILSISAVFRSLFSAHQTTSFFIELLQIIFQILFFRKKVFGSIPFLLVVSLFIPIEDAPLYFIL
jgi:hypothetical protein